MRYWAAGLLLTVLLFGGGWLSSGAAPDVSRSVPGADPGQTGENAGQPAADANTVLRVWDGEQVVEMTMAEYLPGVVRGEMPAAFHQQALDAQAVAERTFIYYHMTSGRKAAHPDADVCMDYRCCNAYTSAQAAAEKWGDHTAEYEAKVQQAVRDTDGQVILYNGQPILAAFHSSSAGVTANSGDVWVSTLPYLHSVESPEGEDTVPNYYSVKEIPAAEFQQTFLAAYPEQSTYSSADFLRKLRAWYARRGIQVECVQTDNGFEFTNRFSGSKRNLPTLFEKTAAELNIRHKLIRPYTPRHNGKVERSHREDQKRFYSCRSFYSLDDFAKQLAVHNRRSNNLPMRPLRWMSPAQVTAQYV